MQIKAEQNGPELRIEVQFDEPAQSIVFNEEFKEMMERVANRLDGVMLDAQPDGSVTKEQMRKSFSDTINKFDSQEE